MNGPLDLPLDLEETDPPYRVHSQVILGVIMGFLSSWTIVAVIDLHVLEWFGVFAAGLTAIWLFILGVFGHRLPWADALYYKPPNTFQFVSMDTPYRTGDYRFLATRILHENPTSKTTLESIYRVDPKTYFRVTWQVDKFPTVFDPHPKFLNASMITSKVQAKLHLEQFYPENIYRLCRILDEMEKSDGSDSNKD